MKILVIRESWLGYSNPVQSVVRLKKVFWKFLVRKSVREMLKLWEALAWRMLRKNKYEKEPNCAIQINNIHYNNDTKRKLMKAIND